MKSHIRLLWKAVILSAGLIVLAQFPKLALAVGTETLGPPGIAIASGSGIAAAGTGLFAQPGTINLNVPGTVNQALLYWSVADSNTSSATDTITVNAAAVTGDRIGGPVSFEGGAILQATYRADITGLVSTGANTLVLDNFSHLRTDGASVLVIFDDGSAGSIDIRDGHDYVFGNTSEPDPDKQVSAPQTFSIAPSSSARTAELVLVGGLATNLPDTTTITVDGTPITLNNLFDSSDGAEWDTEIIPVNIPAGASQVTVEITADSDSIAWSAAGLSLPVEPGIDIEKLTNGNQADGANDGDVPQIAPSDTVTWTYLVTNTGGVPFTFDEVVVTDDQSAATGVVPMFVPGGGTDDLDGILSPNEVWEYTANVAAENLLTTTSGVTIVPGCDPGNTGDTRPTYENIGTVVAGQNTDSDPSHYCNPPQPGIDIEKLTNGNDADGANDADVPQIPGGDSVTWTYRVTNTGNVPFALSEVIVSDDQTGVTPVFEPASDDGDNVLSPNETWIYTASLPAENLVDTTSGVTIVPGCDPDNTGVTRPTYENIGTVVAGNNTDFDPSHYCNPPPEKIGCRFTGGLNDIFATAGGENRYTAGGQAGANTALPPQPKGEWTHTQHSGPAGAFTFHAGTSSAPEGTEIDEIRCSDPGGCKPSGNPPSPAKQLDFDGIGTFKNIGKGNNREPDFVQAGANATAEGNGNKTFDGTFHWFEVNIDDLGEPGNDNPKKNPDDVDPNLCPVIGFGEKGRPGLANCGCSDFYRITIYDGVSAKDVVKNPDGSIDPSQMNRTDVIYEVWGYINGGNLQIHQLTGFDRKNQ